MKALKHLLLLATLSLLPALSTAHSQTTPTAVLLNDQDIAFVKLASQGNAFEVQGGKLARTNTPTAAVRRYGARMVRDHTRDYQILSRIGDRIGVALSGTPSQSQADTLIRFANEFALDFDRDYILTAISDHSTDIREYVKEVEDGLNPALRRFALRALPQLITHLQLAILTANVSGISLK